jgi:hypothetical protein
MFSHNTPVRWAFMASMQASQFSPSICVQHPHVGFGHGKQFKRPEVIMF